MRSVLVAALSSTLCLLFTPCGANAASEAAKQFGTRAFVQQISLAPDATHAAIVAATAGKGEAVLVLDLVKGGNPVPVLRAPGGDQDLTYCRWASNTRLICGVRIITRQLSLIGFTRLLSLNSDGSDLKQLTNQQSGERLSLQQNGGNIIDFGPDQAVGSVLMTRQFVPEYSTGTLTAEQREGLGVELVDATTLKRKIVEAPNGAAEEYISDGHGTVRVRGLRPVKSSGYVGDKIIYSYRKPGDNQWIPLSSTTSGSSMKGFDPEAVDAKLNVAYGFDDDHGRSALYSIALDGSMAKKMLVSNPDVDVDGLIRIGRHRRVVGATYATERRNQEFFDQDLRKLRIALDRAVPNKPLINFVDANEDESKLLLFAGADNDAGGYYLFDKSQRKLSEILPVRPELAGRALAAVKPITFRAADGTAIPAYLTLPPGSDGKNLPAIVMPHGGPADRDEWGFDWLSQFFAARGFAVLQPNYRGSSGYGQAWFQKNGFQSWRTAISDIDDGGRWLLSHGIAAPGKLAIVGWSYGGYAALQSGVTDPDLFKAIVAIAPVTDLDMVREEARNFTNFDLVDSYIGSGPHVAEGSPARHAAQIKAPVLMFHGDLDQNVGIAESRLMKSRLQGAGKTVELVEFPGLDHQLDDSNARAAMLDKADGFLRNALSLPAMP